MAGMTKRGDMRWDETELAEYAARRQRWKKASQIDEPQQEEQEGEWPVGLESTSTAP
jgi:hypothetical protein